MCFVSPHAYPLLFQKDQRLAGGAEVQQVLMAQELKKYNFDISFIVADYGTEAIEHVDGIKVIKSSAQYKGGKFKYIPTLCAFFIALCKANAEIYFLRGPSYLLGIVGLYCKLKKRKLVFSSCIDYESDIRHISEMMSRVSRTFYLHGLRWADVIIVQTAHQKHQFKENLRLDSIVVKNLYTVNSDVPKKKKPPIVLWVGTAAAWKRPHLVIELARALPSVRFRMVMAPGINKALRTLIEKQVKGIENIEYFGFVSYARIIEQYAQASILINTSRWEGFPNTFLQAWAHKIPVVSLEIDPDEVICSNGLGFHSRTFAQMVEDVRCLSINDKLRSKMANDARSYVEREHNVIKNGRCLAVIIDKL